MKIRCNGLLPAGIAAAAAALSMTQAAQTGPLPPTVPRPVLRLNHPAPGGVTPRTVRAVPLRAPQPRRLCRPEGRCEPRPCWHRPSCGIGQADADRRERRIVGGVR
jgi:hypothetical protein